MEEILNGVYLSLNEVIIRKTRKPTTKEYLTKAQDKSTERLGQIEVKVLGKQKTCLKDI